MGVAVGEMAMNLSSGRLWLGELKVDCMGPILSRVLELMAGWRQKAWFGPVLT